MKICHYSSNQAGAVVGEQVYPIGEALVKAGHLKNGYTMLEVSTRWPTSLPRCSARVNHCEQVRPRR